jgi:hypothetical protein
MNPYSITAITVERPPMVPTALTSASWLSVFAIPSLSRSAYSFVSLNFRGSLETRFWSNSSQSVSHSRDSRSRAEIRKWKAQRGHTAWFDTTSLR